MNQIQLNVQTMSSIEIVKLINDYRASNIDANRMYPTLRHADFLAKVPSVIGVEYSDKFRSTYLANNGKENPCYRFKKREACLMAMSYSYELQAIVFDRMTELETQCSKPQIPTTYLDALKALVESEEAKQLAHKQLEIQAPKVDFYDRIADVGNLMTAGVVGKKIGMSAQALNTNLDNFKVYNKRQKGRVFNQWFIGKGYGEIKKTNNGFNSSKFTNKGEQWVVEKLVSEGII